MFPALGSLSHGSINIHGQVSWEPMFWFYLDEDLGDGLCYHMTSVCLTFKKLSNCFPEQLYHSVSPPAVCESPVILHSCQHLVRIFMLPGLQYSSRQVICKQFFSPPEAGCFILSPGDLPDPGIKPESLGFSALPGGFFTTCATLGSPFEEPKFLILMKTNLSLLILYESCFWYHI